MPRNPLEIQQSLIFTAVENEDTLLIYVRYLPTVNRQVMNMNIDTARKVISIKAKAHGWTKWLRIKEDIQQVSLVR